MPFKIYFYGDLKLNKKYLNPSFAAVDVCDDNTHITIHRWYQITWLGKSVNLDIVVKNGIKRPAYFISLFDLIEHFKKLFI